MILYLDRSRSGMIYALDRSCLAHGFEMYRIYINIDKQLIHNFAHLLF